MSLSKSKSMVLSVILSVLMISGCATPLSSGQKQEYRGYQAKGLAVEEKNPGAAAALGILPGFGSFYVREYGAGVVNLLLWPASILWDPMSGYQGAQSINYYATKQKVDRLKDQEVAQLEDQLMMGTIDNREYVSEKREIDNKYSAY
ncbi:hypothetical protein [Marinobacter subterrani]|uniref:hypothetical protein n=1 Tax=Marinobacter subterrani TaxID=1658765 RepID=UPI0023553817|nr:hypothetical protein [Marinobacter subterrani]